MAQLSSAVTFFTCFLAAFSTGSYAFVSNTKTTGHHPTVRKDVLPSSHSSLVIRHAIPPEILEDVEGSRGQFFLWFFGASGASGIARSAFPRMYNQVNYIQSLKGAGPSLGGDTIGVSPLCGYPQDIAVKDIEKVVNNRMTVEAMVKKFPQEGNYLATKGYITFSAFQQANEGSNPLAIRAVFDTFSQSTDVSDPRIAQEKINMYKEDVSAINGSLFKSKVTGFSAVITLLFLLGVADFTAFGHARDGWFHYWKLSDGILNIPDYWI